MSSWWMSMTTARTSVSQSSRWTSLNLSSGRARLFGWLPRISTRTRDWSTRSNPSPVSRVPTCSRSTQRQVSFNFQIIPLGLSSCKFGSIFMFRCQYLMFRNHLKVVIKFLCMHQLCFCGHRHINRAYGISRDCVHQHSLCASGRLVHISRAYVHQQGLCTSAGIVCISIACVHQEGLCTSAGLMCISRGCVHQQGWRASAGVVCIRKTWAHQQGLHASAELVCISTL